MPWVPLIVLDDAVDVVRPEECRGLLVVDDRVDHDRRAGPRTRRRSAAPGPTPFARTVDVVGLRDDLAGRVDDEDAGSARRAGRRRRSTRSSASGRPLTSASESPTSSSPPLRCAVNVSTRRLVSASTSRFAVRMTELSSACDERVEVEDHARRRVRVAAAAGAARARVGLAGRRSRARRGARPRRPRSTEPPSSTTLALSLYRTYAPASESAPSAAARALALRVRLRARARVDVTLPFAKSTPFATPTPDEP